MTLHKKYSNIFASENYDMIVISPCRSPERFDCPKKGSRRSPRGVPELLRGSKDMVLERLDPKLWNWKLDPRVEVD